MATIRFSGTVRRVFLCGIAALAASLAHTHANASNADAFRFQEEAPDDPAAMDFRMEFSSGAERIRPLTAEQRAQPSGLNCTAYCGDTVNYTGWVGDPYVMQEFRAKYVRVLLQQSWFDDPTFTEDRRRMFVNSLDRLYQYLWEMVGRRPGTDLDTMAYVNRTTCGNGCAGVGYNGLEVDSGIGSTAAALDGQPDGLVMHELMHNFDSYGSSYRFSAIGDGPHFWTSIMRAVYSFASNRTDYFYIEHERKLLNYRNLPAGVASWSKCIVQRVAECGDATGHNVLHGLFFRLQHFYGPGTITRWMDFIRNHTNSPTNQDKLDHFFESYSAAANRNINCVFEELNWPVSQTAKDWVNANIGTVQQNPDCTNGPNGKSSILDLAPQFLPPPTPNNFSGVGSGDFLNATSVGFTGTVRSTLTPEQRFFTFNWAVGQRVLVYVCSPAGGVKVDTSIWYVDFDAGVVTIYAGPSAPPNSCYWTTLTVPSGKRMQIRVAGSSNPGDYTIAAVPERSDWMSRNWGQLSVSRNDATNTLTMTVNQIDRSKVRPASANFAGPRAVRFWVQNAGWVAEVPWSNANTFTATWTPPAGETGHGLVFNAQVVSTTGVAADGYATAMANEFVFRIDKIFANGFNP